MKKGFSMIELLIAMAIIMLLSVMIFPSIIKMSKDSRQKAYDKKIELILTYSKEWGSDNLDLLSDVCTNIFVRNLIEDGYIKGDAEDNTVLKNPINNDSMNNIIVCVTYENEDGVYKIKSSIVE